MVMILTNESKLHMCQSVNIKTKNGEKKDNNQTNHSC